MEAAEAALAQEHEADYRELALVREWNNRACDDRLRIGNQREEEAWLEVHIASQEASAARDEEERSEAHAATACAHARVMLLIRGSPPAAAKRPFWMRTSLAAKKRRVNA